MLKRFLNKSIFVLALFALAGNVALPAFAASKKGAPPQTQTASQSASNTAAFFGKVLICTLEGYKWVSLEDLRTGNVPDTPHQGQNCPLCTANGSGMLALTPIGGAYVVWAPLQTASYAGIPQAERRHSLTAANIKNPRAPPHPVSLS